METLKQTEGKTDNELLANQDLIDDFMGREHWRMHPNHEWVSYHNDWNRLMPVVEKINSQDGYSAIHIDHDQAFIHFSETERMVDFLKEDHGYFGMIYQAVVTYVKWLKTQHK